MRQICFQREKMNSYMVMTCDEKLNRNIYSEAILENAKIPGLMNYEIRDVDGEQTLYYKLVYRTSLKQVLGDVKLTFDLLETMISSMVDVIKQTEEYLLDSGSIIWKSEYVFIEIHSGKLSFAYYPKMQEENNSIKNLLVELFQYVEKNNRQAYQYLMEFYNLVTNPDCTLKQMEQYTRNNHVDSNDFVSEMYQEDPLVISTKQEKKVSCLQNKKDDVSLKKNRFVIMILIAVNLIVSVLLLLDIWTYQYIWVLIVTLFLLFVAFLSGYPKKEEESPDKIMEEYFKEHREDQHRDYYQQSNIRREMTDMETTVLCTEYQEIVTEDAPRELCLKSMNPQKYSDIYIEKNSIVLGCMLGSCSYLIKENGISRMHAKLIKKEDGLFLIDMNSTNGTYLNDELLVGGKEYLLEEGDVISLARLVTFAVTVRSG